MARKNRPTWQRYVYPFAGLVLVIAGIIGSILPVIPGVPLLVVGLPLLCCFHPRAEAWAEELTQRTHRRILTAWRRWSRHSEK